MKGIEIALGTVAMVGALIIGARWVGALAERHVGLGLLAFATMLSALVLAVYAYGWAVRR